MNNLRVKNLIIAVMLFNTPSVWAQEKTTMDSMPGMDHSQMQHGTNKQAAAKDTDMKNSQPENKMPPVSMQGGSAPADARDPHAYSGGYDFGAIPRPVFADELNFASLLVNRFESVNTRDNTSARYDLQGWFGRDYDRLVLKAEGDIDNGNLQEASTELLWGHAVATFWDTQVGVRYDSAREEPDRTWLAVGIQGLAPYWFEFDATAYLGDEGRSAITVESEYELLITQKLILQPRFEASAYGKRDPELGRGSGLSDVSLGLRLRYEFWREFAPYLGIEWTSKYGETKDFAQAAGNDPSETQFVAGIRFWF